MSIDVRSIEEQGLKHWNIKNDELAGRLGAERFNGSIVKYNDKILLAYRTYSQLHGRSNVAITELDEDYKVLSNKELFLYSTNNDPILEDARLFIHKGRLHISYVDLCYTGPRWIAIMRVARLHDNYDIDHVIPVTFGQNGKGTEKNWNFFSHEDRLLFVYDSNAHHVIEVHDKTGIKCGEWGDKGIYWPYGHVRGGTPPVKHTDDEYLSFFHSSDYKAWQGRRYSMTPYTFQAEPPFNMIRCGREPILWGSLDNGFCNSGNGQCIFPMGVLTFDDHYHVSCGINDSHNTIVEISKESVDAIMDPVDLLRISKVRFFYTEKAAGAPEDGRHWEILKSSGKGMIGIFHTSNIIAITGLLMNNRVKEITEERFNELLNAKKKKEKQIVR